MESQVGMNKRLRDAEMADAKTRIMCAARGLNPSRMAWAISKLSWVNADYRGCSKSDIAYWIARCAWSGSYFFGEMDQDRLDQAIEALEKQERKG